MLRIAKRKTRTAEDDVRIVRYAFEKVRNKYKFYHRNMSENDQNRLTKYSKHLVNIRETSATDLAFEILTYMATFHNTDLGV